jgi:hypothetical protein
MNNSPIWDFDQAREACRVASKAQESAEEALRQAARDLARAEEAYRLALAKKITELRAQGMAATLCADLARGDAQVARLRFNRDVADGVREASLHAAWRRNQDRKDCQRFADWSQRRELAEGGAVGHEQPEWSEATR